MPDHPFISMYGHLGYAVKPPHRGNKYASRACKLLFPLAKSHGLQKLIIICESNNIASCKTCEALGGVFESEYTVALLGGKKETRKKYVVQL